MTATHAGSLSDLIRVLRSDKGLARTHVVHIRFAGEIDWQARVRDGATEDRRFTNGQWTEWRKCSISGTGPAVLVALDDADRVTTEAMRALFAERRPCAGWAPDGYFPPGLAYELRAGEFSARVDEAGIDQAGDSEWGWSVAGPSPYERIIVRRNYAPTLEAAQLAAEDALNRIAAEIIAALERR